MVERSTSTLFFVLLITVVFAADDEKKCWRNVHKAANRGDDKKMTQLLAKDRFQADAEDKCESGVRPLMLAAHGGHTQVVSQAATAGGEAAFAIVAPSATGAVPTVGAQRRPSISVMQATATLRRPLRSRTPQRAGTARPTPRPCSRARQRPVRSAARPEPS